MTLYTHDGASGTDISAEISGIVLVPNSSALIGELEADGAGAAVNINNFSELAISIPGTKEIEIECEILAAGEFALPQIHCDASNNGYEIQPRNFSADTITGFDLRKDDVFVGQVNFVSTLDWSGGGQLKFWMRTVGSDLLIDAFVDDVLHETLTHTDGSVLTRDGAGFVIKRSGGSPRVFSTDDKISSSTPSVTADKAVAAPGEVVTLTPSNFGGALTTAQLKLGGTNLGAALSISGNAFTMPGHTDFLRSAAYENVPPNVDLVVTIGDGTDTVDITLQLAYVTDAFPAAAGDRVIMVAPAGPYPSNSSFEAGTTLGDMVSFEVISGGITNITADGIMELSADSDIDRKWFENAATPTPGKWSAKDRIAATASAGLAKIGADYGALTTERGLTLTLDIAPKVTGSFNSVTLVGPWPTGSSAANNGLVQVLVASSVALGAISGLSINVSDGTDTVNIAVSSLTVEEAVVESIGPTEGVKDKSNDQVASQNSTTWIVNRALLDTIAVSETQVMDANGTVKRLVPGSNQGDPWIMVLETDIGGQTVLGIKELSTIRRNS